MDKIIFILIFGVIGGLAFQKWHIPGGAVVGSMIFSGIPAIALVNEVVLSSRVSTIVQIILGISLGLTFDKSFLKFAPKVIPIAIISTLILLGASIVMSLIAHKLGLIDFGTALFGLSPGGMTGMALIAKGEGMKTSVVAFLHVVRIFTLFVVVPLVVRCFFPFSNSIR